MLAQDGKVSDHVEIHHREPQAPWRGARLEVSFGADKVLSVYIRDIYGLQELMVGMRELSAKLCSAGSVDCRTDQHEEARPRGLQ